MIRRVLIVDDDALPEKAVRALEQRGVDSCAVSEGVPRRFSARRPGEFDGVVLDLRMPAFSGLDLLATLIQRRPGLSVVCSPPTAALRPPWKRCGWAPVIFSSNRRTPTRFWRLWRATSPAREKVPPEVPSLDRVEWEHIGRVLADCGGNISQVARLLGLDRRTLQRKLGKFPPRH